MSFHLKCWEKFMNILSFNLSLLSYCKLISFLAYLNILFNISFFNSQFKSLFYFNRISESHLFSTLKTVRFINFIFNFKFFFNKFFFLIKFCQLSFISDSLISNSFFMFFKVSLNNNNFFNNI